MRHDVRLMSFSPPAIVKYLCVICTADSQSLGSILICTIHDQVSDHVSMAHHPRRHPSLLAWKFYLAAFLELGNIRIIMIGGREV